MTLHQPVMLNEMLDALEPRDRETYVDATFGRGGYSRGILEAADSKVIAIDRDPEAIKAGLEIAADYGNRLTLKQGVFSSLSELIEANDAIDGIVFDLGLSSPQIDNAERGFSFRQDGPLDMRMGKDGLDAADFINTAPEQEIARVLWEYGEERASRRIARAIVKARLASPITRTLGLANIIHSVMPRPKFGQIDPATRSFQAIRIHINSELDEIRKALSAAEMLLKPGGRLVVIAFHSLEDRIIKTFFINRSGQAPKPSRHLPHAAATVPSFTLPHRKPRLPTDAEININPRARSAKLRTAIRTDAPVDYEDVA